MKLFTALLCSMVALAFASVINPEDGLSLAKREVERAVADTNVDLVTVDLEDGGQEVDFEVDGVTEGYLVISPDGDVRGYEANGDEVDLDAPLQARDTALSKRNWLRLLLKLGPVIKKFGTRVLAWLRCVGTYTQILNCGESLIRCAQVGQPPWECIAGIACIGKSAKNCGAP